MISYHTTAHQPVIDHSQPDSDCPVVERGGAIYSTAASAAGAFTSIDLLHQAVRRQTADSSDHCPVVEERIIYCLLLIYSRRQT